MAERDSTIPTHRNAMKEYGKHIQAEKKSTDPGLLRACKSLSDEEAGGSTSGKAALTDPS